MDVLKKIPVRNRTQKERATNFKEVCLGYNQEEAQEEASRCINCKNAKCIQGCPVAINIPKFIAEVKEGKFEDAANTIAESSALPAVCGRVCPSGEPVRRQMYPRHQRRAYFHRKAGAFRGRLVQENGFVPAKPEKTNGIKVAVIGSGPAGLTCAGDLAKMGYEVTILKPFMSQAACLHMEFLNSVFQSPAWYSLKSTT